MIDLSIIIVNYNTQHLLYRLLTSVAKSAFNNKIYEVIVVDNASCDKSIVMIKKTFPTVKLISNQKNLGFSKANNQAIKLCQGRLVLLLNSDTLLMPKTLPAMIDFMDKNVQFAAATCRIELPNGNLDQACHRGFPTPWAALTFFSGLENVFPRSILFGSYHQTWKDLTKIHEVDVISGAFFLLRRAVIQKIGLLDERFFAYAEDIDWCLRIRKKGYKIAFNPQTKVIHYKTSSGRKKFQGKKITQEEKIVRQMAKKHFFETMKLFYDKHYTNQYPLLLRWLVLNGIKVVSLFKE